MLLRYQQTRLYELMSSVPGSILGKARRNLEEKQKLSEPVLGPSAFLFKHYKTGPRPQMQLLDVRCNRQMFSLKSAVSLSLSLNLFIAVSLSACTSSSSC